MINSTLDAASGGAPTLEQLKRYYEEIYPAELVVLLARLESGDQPASVDWMCRYRQSRQQCALPAEQRHDTVTRHLHVSSADELLRIVRAAEYPADGVHYDLGACATRALQFDVDYDPVALPREGVICTCRNDDRRVCDRCWQTLAGVCKGYQYVLCDLLCLDQVLCVYSGNRGVHFHVCDPAALGHSNVSMQRRIYDELTRMVPDTLTALVAYFATVELERIVTMSLDALLGDEALTVQLRGNKLTPQSSAVLCSPWVLRLYRCALWPHFRQQWTPRLTNNSRASAADGRALAAAALRSTHSPPHTLAPCRDCALLGVCEQLSAHYTRRDRGALDARYATADSLAPLGVASPPRYGTYAQLDDAALGLDAGDDCGVDCEDAVQRERFDSLLLVLRTLWLPPDEHLLDPAHPLRAVFSPHARGSLCVPLDVEHAHDFRPASNAPSVPAVLADRTLLAPAKRLFKNRLYVHHYRSSSSTAASSSSTIKQT
jgi:hypothetical protein